MPTKKPAHAKKPARKTERRAGLTSALGPKATTMLVIAVLTGGLVVGQIQRSEEIAKDREAMMMVGTAGSGTSPEAAPQPKKAAAKRSAPAPVATTAANTAVKSPFVTVAGCLERKDEAFRLKDTAGEDAPRTRSWKSGFLKKSSASIDVVDTTSGVTLASHVGRRVSVTGTLTGREMKASSVRRLAASCS
jgi:hypothetical protein